MPQPPVILRVPRTGSGVHASVWCKSCPEQDRGCRGDFAELTAAVDKLTVRQDVLIDLINKQHVKFAEQVDDCLGEWDQVIRSASKMNTKKIARGEAEPPVVHAKSTDTRKTATSNTSMRADYMMAARIRNNETTALQLADLETKYRRGPSDNTIKKQDTDVKDNSWATIVKDVVRSRKFEMASGAVVFSNMFFLLVYMQWHSCELAFVIGHSADDCGWNTAKVTFETAEQLFNVWYTAELLLRVYASRWKFFADKLNLADIAVVCVSFLQHAFEKVQVPGIALMRFLRVLRALRVIRIIRLLAIFRELHIVLETLSASFYSLQWSMCILGSILWSAGLLVMQLVEPYIRDTAQGIEMRESMYLQYGSPSRAVYSMFVATFSTAWVSMAFDMIEHVNPLLGCFWILYIVVVNFAVIRVIAALFLKQTMDVASHDSERRAMESQKEKEKFAHTLYDIFTEYDTSGDGLICKSEFAHMIDSPDVLKAFETLGLEYEDVCALFEIMSSDDGYADYDEFLTGALQMRSSARTFDALRIMHELGCLSRSMQMVEHKLGILQPKAPGY